MMGLNIETNDPALGLQLVQGQVRELRKDHQRLDAEIAALKADIEEIRRNGTGAGVSG